MSELLESLHTAVESPKSWAEEVATTPATEDAPVAPPEPVAVEAAPEAPSAPNDAYEAPEDAGEAPDRRVPLKALQEERAKRAEYERKLIDYERQFAEIQAYVAGASQQVQPQQPQEQWQEPDPETDPIGALKYAREQMRQLQEMTSHQQHAQQEQQFVQQLTNVAYQAATDYAQKVPDYRDAYQYALQSRAQELAAIGTPPQAIRDVINREELNFVATTLQNGRNPAEAIYQFAKARGYQGKPAAPAPSATPEMQQAKQAVAASATSGGSSASKGQLSISEITNLHGAAFDSAWDKLMKSNKSSVFRE